MPIPEGDLVVPTLRLLSKASSGFMSTTDLIAELEAQFQPGRPDADILDGRSDTKFSQKVRNLVSHRGSGTGLETRGLAQYDRSIEGWFITDKGRQYVEDIDASA